jgi:ABC-type antimicrobial peptide transport system permease subunit
MISIGFKKSAIFSLVMMERMFLVLIALVTGIIPAVVSGIPSLSSSLYASLWVWLPIISLLVLLSGLAGSYIAMRLAFKRNLVESLRNE